MKFQNKYNKQQGVAILDKENISDNSGITVNSEQIQALKDIFPNCFDKDGKFIKSKLDKALRDSKINFAKESYTLDWLGKSYARLLANEKPLSVMSEDKNFNLNKTTENLLIKGDNLEVLKHLKNAYYKSIKMIYIDPPYNTGTDFIYQDKREFTKEKLSQKAGISEEEAQRILEFIDKGSNSHSAWLTFMYPRLYVARQLLEDDGVIFISIDDNEQAQLKMLCDEIFGEENFIANLIWQKKKGGGGSDSEFFQKEHEYVLCYTKKSWKILDKTDEYNETDFNKTINNRRAKIRKLEKDGDNALRIDRPTLYYPIKDPSGNDFYPVAPNNEDGRWRKKPENLDKDHIFWQENSRGRLTPYEVTYFDEVEKEKIIKTRTIFTEFGTTTEATKEIQTLFNGKKVFDTPKPTNLLKKLMQVGTDDDDIILDFFAGSGTTAHAAMAQNLEDGGSRKFILVQLDEKLKSENKSQKIAYDFCKNELRIQEPSIFDITRERLIRAKNKLVEVNQDKDMSKFDLDFKIYEIIKKDKFIEDMERFDNNASLPLYECDANAIVTTWKLYDGIKLDKNLEEIKLKEYIAHYDGDKKLYLINPNFTHDDLVALVEKIDSDKTFKPNVIVIYGKHFESAMQNEICHNLNVITNAKSIELKIIIRDI
ncbi:site-specific DNA-methyltransferase [Campylobacter sp. MOP7]|uniref:site-specific DNA-methyltransferase n=1 Tax=Campylobacter canis TaxID=3378588 RepID=UPI00387E3A8B